MRPRAVLLLAGPALLLTLFFAWPLARTLSAASPDAWGWAGTHPFVRSRLAGALMQAALSAALTLALALPLAWFYHRRDVPHGRLQRAVHAAPFVLPFIVVVFGLQAVLGSRGLTDRMLGLDVLAVVGPLGAVALAHAYYDYGFAARILHAGLERRPRRLEEAAQVLGAPPRAAFWRVTAPLLLPTVAAAGLLSFFFAFTSFGIVLYLGQGQVSTLETLLYEALGGAFPRLDRAAALGALQLLLNLLLLAAFAVLTQRQARLPQEPPRARRPARAAHVAWSWALLGLALLPALAVLLEGFQLRGAWSFEPWSVLLDPSHPRHLAGFDLGRAVGLTLLYAASCMVLSIALTLSLAAGLRRLGGRWARIVEALAALPLGTSSLLVGLGYLLAFGAGAGLLDLRGSVLLVVVAHTLVAFPFTARALLPALEQHDVRLDEAAALLGARPREVALRVQWPLLRGPIVVAAGLAAAISIGDFGASLLLMRPDTMGLGVWVAQHGGAGAFDPLSRAESYALAGLLMLLAAAAYVGVERARGEAEA
ncbi:MAG: ABC transporter permease subunit [Halobacteriales archaeon]|nr:ABC transporter permease subunit [Halobacteriales archaeon]